jgi:hypothetical protein
MFRTKVVEKIKIHNLHSTIYSENHVVEKYGRAKQATDENVTRRMRFICRITKATDIHSEYVILIAFPQQQWLRERSSILRHTYIAFLVLFSAISSSGTGAKMSERSVLGKTALRQFLR